MWGKKTIFWLDIRPRQYSNYATSKAELTVIHRTLYPLTSLQKLSHLLHQTDHYPCVWMKFAYISLHNAFINGKCLFSDPVSIWASGDKNLKKLPQAFMQIGWMENYFRKLTAIVFANLDNPIKNYDFSKVWLILCMSPSQVALF